jgi:hypothetical protein
LLCDRSGIVVHGQIVVDEFTVADRIPGIVVAEARRFAPRLIA